MSLERHVRFAASLGVACTLMFGAAHALSGADTRATLSSPASCPAISSIRFLPRPGQAARMLHGRFSGSNESATTGFETLVEVQQTPAEGKWSELSVPNPRRFRFVKYEAPNDSWGNVAEIEFCAGGHKVSGTAFGTTGSKDGSDYTKALDGKGETYFEGGEPNNQYVGLDFGPETQAAAPDFSPKPGSYQAPQAVAMTSVTMDAKVRFVRGGGTPGPGAGEEFEQPVKVEHGQIFVAVASAGNLAPSRPVVAAYRIGETNTENKLVRTFHIGNSLTDTVDGWLKPVAESAGHPLDFHRFTIPGAPTEWLWAHPGSGFGDTRYAEAFFAYAPIDHLITQPFAGHGRSVENEAEYGSHFYQVCRAQSPAVKWWLYQQWPERPFGESWSQGTLPLGKERTTWAGRVQLRPGESLADGGWQGVVLKTTAPANWSEAVANHSRYFGILHDELQRQHPGVRIGIIPGGPVLARVKTAFETGQMPGLTDFFREMFDDGIHLTAKGRYLVSLVHYCCFFNESPEGRVPPLNSGLTEEQAKLFQRLAWEVVKARQDSN